MLLTYKDLFCRCLDNVVGIHNMIHLERRIYIFPQNGFLVLLKMFYGDLRQPFGSGRYVKESVGDLCPCGIASVKTEYCRKSQLALKFHVQPAESHPKSSISGQNAQTTRLLHMCSF